MLRAGERRSEGARFIVKGRVESQNSVGRGGEEVLTERLMGSVRALESGTSGLEI